MLCDGHIHLDFFESPEQLAGFVQRCLLAGVRQVAVPGCSQAQWMQMDQRLAKLDPTMRVLRGYGVHPYWSVPLAEHEPRQRALEELKRRLQHADFVGEIGVDKGRGAARSVQVELAHSQWRLARDLELPCVVHQVGCRDELLGLFDELAEPEGVLVHGFGGDAGWGQALLNRGAFLGVGAAILNPARARLREAVARLPLDKLLVETDEPPQPPLESPEAALPLRRVVAELARLRSEPENLIAEVSSENFRRFYRLPASPP